MYFRLFWFLFLSQKAPVPTCLCVFPRIWVLFGYFYAVQIKDLLNRQKLKTYKRQELYWLKKETILMQSSYIILQELSLQLAVSSSLKLCIRIRYIWLSRFSPLYVLAHRGSSAPKTLVRLIASPIATWASIRFEHVKVFHSFSYRYFSNYL